MSGCALQHEAVVRVAELPPLSAAVLHSGRLWLDLSAGVPENTCVTPAEMHAVCFEDVRRELASALSRSLWTSFRGVSAASGERQPGDYVLQVWLGLDALPPDAAGPGWSAAAHGGWRLERDGKTLAGELVASRSRADFPYGAPLGVGAGEAIDAVAVRIGMTLGSLPETHVVAPVPLPPVVTSPLPEAPAPAAQNPPAR